MESVSSRANQTPDLAMQRTTELADLPPRSRACRQEPGLPWHREPQTEANAGDDLVLVLLR